MEPFTRQTSPGTSSDGRDVPDDVLEFLRGLPDGSAARTAAWRAGS